MNKRIPRKKKKALKKKDKELTLLLRRHIDKMEHVLKIPFPSIIDEMIQFADKKAIEDYQESLKRKPSVDLEG